MTALENLPLTFLTKSDNLASLAWWSNTSFCLFLYVISILCCASVDTVFVVMSGRSIPVGGLVGRPAMSKRMDLEAWDALSGANSNDIAVICFSVAFAIDMMIMCGLSDRVRRAERKMID